MCHERPACLDDFPAGARRELKCCRRRPPVDGHEDAAGPDAFEQSLCVCRSIAGERRGGTDMDRQYAEADDS